MIVRISELRGMIKIAILERMSPPARNALSPGRSSREQIKSIGASNPDPDLAPHLKQAEEDEGENVLGPVPPENGEPYIMQDPFVRDHNIIPRAPFTRLKS